MCIFQGCNILAGFRCFPALPNQVLVSNSLSWLQSAFLVVVAVFTRGVRVTSLCQGSFWENSLRAAKTSTTTAGVIVCVFGFGFGLFFWIGCQHKEPRERIPSKISIFSFFSFLDKLKNRNISFHQPPEVFHFSH